MSAVTAGRDFVTHEECGRADEVTECGGCYGMWCDRCDPAHGPLCPWCHGRGYSTAAIRRPLYRQANHVHPSEYTAQEDDR
jgi:hypothetical protein